MSEKVFIHVKDGQPAYEAWLLGAVWSDDVATKHPAFCIWACTSGAEKPIRASVITGGKFSRVGWANDVKWSKRNSPRMERREILDRNEKVDHIQTIAYYPAVCNPNPIKPFKDEDRVVFIAIPSTDQMVDEPVDLADSALKHFGLVEYKAITRFWDSYSQILLLYLSARISAPLMTSRLARYLTLAAAVRLQAVRWAAPIGTGCNHSTHPTQHNTDLESLGYAIPLVFAASPNTIDQICRIVPMMISQAYGTEFLMNDEIPTKFLDIDRNQADSIVDSALEVIRNG